MFLVNVVIEYYFCSCLQPALTILFDHVIIYVLVNVVI